MYLLIVHGFLVPIIGGLIQQLAVSEPVHHKNHLLDSHGALIVHCLRSIHNQGAPGGGEFSLDGSQILLDDAVHLGPASQDFLILRNLP